MQFKNLSNAAVSCACESEEEKLISCRWAQVQGSQCMDAHGAGSRQLWEQAAQAPARGQPSTGL